MEKHLHFFMQHLQGTVYVMPRRTPAASVQFPDFLLCVTPEKVKVNDFPLFLRQRGQGFGKLPARKDNPLTAYRNRVLLTRVYKIFICCTEWVKLFFGEVFKGYFPLPPLIPVTPCVDSCIVYDYSAKGIKCVFDMLLVCFCASHK